MENSEDVEIVVGADGTVRHIHSDAATAITKEVGAVTITRASHVEPDADGNWWADLAPVGGPKLGPYPPDARDRALADEVAWLRAKFLHCGPRRDEAP